MPNREGGADADLVARPSDYVYRNSAFEDMCQRFYWGQMVLTSLLPALHSSCDSFFGCKPS